MMYTCISLIVHPPFEIPGSAPELYTQKMKRITIIIIIRGTRLGAMGTRTKVMKTTKNVTIKIILKMIPFQF